MADSEEHKIRRISPNGTITTVAGNGNYGYSGDGGAALNAQVSDAEAVAVDAVGNIFVVDTNHDRVRKISRDGIITAVAGTGEVDHPGAGDGGPALNAELDSPQGLAVDREGNLFIADSIDNKVREVSPNGTITTVAGNGKPGYSGDGGPAISAELNHPIGIAVDREGNLFIADIGNRRVRKVSPNGNITTIAGNGNEGYSGDGGAATEAALSAGGVALDSKGNIYVADYENRAVRVLRPTVPPSR